MSSHLQWALMGLFLLSSGSAQTILSVTAPIGTVAKYLVEDRKTFTVRHVSLDLKYQIIDRGLPPPLIVGQAVAVEVLAILSGLLTALRGNVIGVWPAWTTTFNLLIWGGNAYVRLCCLNRIRVG